MDIAAWRDRRKQADTLTDIAILRERLKQDYRNRQKGGAPDIDKMCQALEDFVRRIDPAPRNPSFEGLDVVADFCLRAMVCNPLRFSGLFGDLALRWGYGTADASLVSGLTIVYNFLSGLGDDGEYALDNLRDAIVFAPDEVFPPRRMAERLLVQFSDVLETMFEDPVDEIISAYRDHVRNLAKDNNVIVSELAAQLEGRMDEFSESFDEIFAELKTTLANDLGEARPVLEESLNERVAGEISNGGSARDWVLAAFFLYGEADARQRLSEILGPAEKGPAP